MRSYMETFASPPAFQAHYVLGIEDNRLVREVAEGFASTIGRDVLFTLPHGGLLNPEDFEHHLALARGQTDTRDETPFTVAFYSAPRPNGDWREGTPVRGTHSPSGTTDMRVMMDSVTPFDREASLTNLVNDLRRYGIAIGSPFIGLVDSRELFLYLNLVPDYRECNTHDAFLFKDVLFVPYDLPHVITEGSAAAMRIILNAAAADLYANDSSSFDNRSERIQERLETERIRRLELMRSQATTFANNLGNSAINDLREEALTLNATAQRHRSSYLDTMRSAGITMAHAEALKKQTEKTQVSPDLVTLDRMIANGTLTSISFDEMRVTANTKILLAYDPRTEAQHLVAT